MIIYRSSEPKLTSTSSNGSSLIWACVSPCSAEGWPNLLMTKIVSDTLRWEGENTGCSHLPEIGSAHLIGKLQVL